MGSVRARKESGNLMLDFRYLNVRCREQTSLPDTPANRRKAEALLKRIEAEITLGGFDYEKYFPHSKQLKRIQVLEGRISAASGHAPGFADFARRWFNEMRVGWRASYEETMKFIVFKRLIPYFDALNLAQIKRQDILDFRVYLSDLTNDQGRLLSNETINRHIKVLNSILNEAAARYEFPPPTLNIKPLKKQRPDVDPFNLDEIELIVNNVRKDFRDYYIIRFFTGMRPAEIDGLKWRYVEFQSRQILIRETHTRQGTEDTKTDASQREIQMSELVYDALARQHKVTGQMEYVFCTRAGTPLSHNNVTKRIWNPLLRHLGLRHRRAYETRHTAATLWLASGENAEWVARQLGHASTEMLFRKYSRFVPNLTRRDGSAFEQLISSNLDIDQRGKNDD